MWFCHLESFAKAGSGKPPRLTGDDQWDRARTPVPKDFLLDVDPEVRSLKNTSRVESVASVADS